MVLLDPNHDPESLLVAAARQADGAVSPYPYTRHYFFPGADVNAYAGGYEFPRTHEFVEAACPDLLLGLLPGAISLPP